MPSSEVVPRVALVKTEVTEEHIASIIRVTRIGELGPAAVTSSPIFVSLIIEAILSSETSVRTRATLRNIQGDGILL
jgi:hypothetical protein